MTNINNNVLTLEFFESNLQRPKRALLEFVGTISNWLFGLMDANSAREYDKKINELQTKSSDQNNLILNQMSIVKKTIVETNSAFKELKDKIESITDEISEIQLNTSKQNFDNNLQEDFQNLAHIATLTISEHLHVSENLRKTLQNSLNGKIFDLVPAQELKDNVSIIAKTLDLTQMLPFNVEKENIYNLFKSTSIKSTLFNKKIFIELKIPILERDEFLLYEAIPIPTKK